MKSVHHMVALDTGDLTGVFVTGTGVGKTWVGRRLPVSWCAPPQ